MSSLKHITKHLENVSRKEIKTIVRFAEYKYPKLILLCASVIIAYFIFKNQDVQSFVSGLDSLSYLGIFIAGLLFSFGFSTPFAIGFFIISNPDNLLLAALIGGIGALTSDLLIFKIIKFSFMDEFERLEHTHFMKKINKVIKSNFKFKLSNYLIYFFAGIIIASPLPDELGVTMLAGLTEIKPGIFAIVSFIMNYIGILIMLLI
ncbi:MAG: hypothetical protein AABX73_04420 [Nanoarchaeota archaeon]